MYRAVVYPIRTAQVCGVTDSLDERFDSMACQKAVGARPHGLNSGSAREWTSSCLRTADLPLIIAVCCKPRLPYASLTPPLRGTAILTPPCPRRANPETMASVRTKALCGPLADRRAQSKIRHQIERSAYEGYSCLTNNSSMVPANTPPKIEKAPDTPQRPDRWGPETGQGGTESGAVEREVPQQGHE